ncbi:MAG: NAD-dependent deacylase [Dehalococcoidales bacterium]|jgi:NAD-dependent deacetylase
MKEDLAALADRVAGLIAAAAKVVVFSGAGISTESGLPDFRSPGGIWERFDPEDFTYQKFVSDPAARAKHWRLLKDLSASVAPNPAHYAIAELYRLGRLDCVVTQNVDNLQQRAGLPAERVFELHGNMQSLLCLGCRHRYPFDDIKARLETEEVPDCPACGGILKPAVVFFGEPLPEDVLKEASRRARGSNLFIVVGSTLTVYPAAYLPDYALAAGAKLVIVNLSATPLDSRADVVIRARAGEAMAAIVARLKERPAV